MKAPSGISHFLKTNHSSYRHGQEKPGQTGPGGRAHHRRGCAEKQRLEIDGEQVNQIKHTS